MVNVSKKQEAMSRATRTRSNDQISAEEQPPAYSAPVIVAGPSSPPLPPRRRTIPGFPDIDFAKYAIPNSELSFDKTTLTTYTAAFSSNPTALNNLIDEQLALPPRPEIHIIGRNGMSNSDFMLKLNLMRYLLPIDGTRWNYVKLVSEGELACRGGPNPALKPTVNNGIKDWAFRFCREQSSNKSFVIERHVMNWNTEYLEGQIRSVIAKSGYAGQVTVNFVIAHSKVVIRPPLKGNKLWTSITNAFQEEKKWEVVKATWPYANQPPGCIERGSERTCAVQSEEIWWSDWKEVIRAAVAAGKSGWLSLDDLVEMTMDPKNTPAII